MELQYCGFVKKDWVVDERFVNQHRASTTCPSICQRIEESVALAAEGLDAPIVRFEFASQILDMDVNRSFGHRLGESQLYEFGASKDAPWLGSQDFKEPILGRRKDDVAVADSDGEALGNETEVGWVH
jgi:hypothetical protein